MQGRWKAFLFIVVAMGLLSPFYTNCMSTGMQLSNTAYLGSTALSQNPAVAPVSLHSSALGIVYLADAVADTVTGTGSNASIAAAAFATNADGVKLRIGWAQVETAAGTYDWSVIDIYVAQALATKKFLGLELIAGTQSPAWLYALTNPAVATGTFVKSSVTKTLPLPWDSTFQTRWSSFLMAAGKKYDSVYSLAYVTMSGLGFSSETIMPNNMSPAFDSTSTTQMGEYVGAGKAMIDIYAKAFPTTPFLLAMNNIVVNTPATWTGSNVGGLGLQSVVSYGLSTYPKLFGIQNNGLEASYSTNPTNNANDYYFNQQIESVAGLTTVGYQLTCSSTANSVCTSSWLAGSMTPAPTGANLITDAVLAGVAMKAHFVEVYPTDVTTYATNMISLSAQIRANYDN
jgi:hypothetical protein